MPPKRSPPMLYHRAIQLRKEPTAAEAKLWAYLRGNKLNGVNFRRQHAIGQYIVDYCALKKKLVIELDGSQHLEQEEYDRQRTLFLEAQGYSVIPFWNDQVMNDIDGVIETITNALKAPLVRQALTTSPDLPHSKGTNRGEIERDCFVG